MPLRHLTVVIIIGFLACLGASALAKLPLLMIPLSAGASVAEYFVQIGLPAVLAWITGSLVNILIWVHLGNCVAWICLRFRRGSKRGRS